MSTPNLAIAHVVESQNLKEITLNSGLDLLDKAMNSALSVVFANANKILSSTEALQNAMFLCTGPNAASRNLIVPTNKKFYVVNNATTDSSSPATGPFSIVVKTSAGTGITIANGKTATVYCDGTNVIRTTPDV